MYPTPPLPVFPQLKIQRTAGCCEDDLEGGGNICILVIILYAFHLVPSLLSNSYVCEWVSLCSCLTPMYVWLDASLCSIIWLGACI